MKKIMIEKDSEIAQLKAEIGRLTSLIERAADTLEEEFGEPNLGGQDLSQKSPWNLIIELRKAIGHDTGRRETD